MSIVAHRAAVQPTGKLILSDLLPEILCHIFLRTVTDADAAPLTITVPLRISHVCRNWRDVALSLGQLWSYLSLIFFTAAHLRREQAFVVATMEIFYTWLQRTKKTPLNFKIFCDCANALNDSQRGIVEGIFGTLLSEQRRWRNVVLWWPEFYPSLNFPRIIANDMPELTSLTLGWGRVRYPEQDTAPALVDISRSPKLRSLQLCHHVSLVTGTTPLHALTELSWLLNNDTTANVNVPSVQKCFDLLRIMPNLNQFCIGVGHEHDPDVINNADRHIRNMQPLLLPQIHTFVLDLRDKSSFILDRLSLPGLRALEMELCHTEHLTGAGDAFVNFILRSNSPLTCLRLTGGYANEDYLLSVLVHVPDLEELDITYASVTRLLFRSLTVADNSNFALESDRSSTSNSALCPALRYFRFYGLHFLDTDDATQITSAFYDMVTSRWTSLKTFTMFRVWHDTRNKLFHLPIPPGGPEYQVLQDLIKHESGVTVRSEQTVIYPMYITFFGERCYIDGPP